LRDAPTGLTFKICTLCHNVCVCFVFISEQTDFCHLQHKLIGFYNRDKKCLLRGTNWVFNP